MTKETEGDKAKAAEARRAYKREWQRNNRDRVKASQERYWMKRAERANQASGATGAQDGGNPKVTLAILIETMQFTQALDHLEGMMADTKAAVAAMDAAVADARAAYRRVWVAAGMNEDCLRSMGLGAAGQEGDSK